MPVFSDRVLLDRGLRDSVGWASGAGAPWVRRRRPGAADVIEIGLVNNMPDGALAATERQFRSLLDAAAGTAPVRLRLFTLPGIPRGERGAQLCTEYAALDEIWDRRLDALIVTGTEPSAADFRDEPYWDRLTELLDWAELGGVPTIASCLAAHAAVLHADGIERRALPEKRCGVFAHETVVDHPLTRGVAAPLASPHSRCNDLPESALLACGYHVLTRSAAAGVDMFAREQRSLLVCFQGHPEYDAATLLREYRRDIRRFLVGARARYPAAPVGIFDQMAAERLAAFRDRALNERREALMRTFPVAAETLPQTAPWQAAAVAFFRNWLAYVRGRHV